MLWKPGSQDRIATGASTISPIANSYRRATSTTTCHTGVFSKMIFIAAAMHSSPHPVGKNPNMLTKRSANWNSVSSISSTMTMTTNSITKHCIVLKYICLSAPYFSFALATMMYTMIATTTHVHETKYTNMLLLWAAILSLYTIPYCIRKNLTLTTISAILPQNPVSSKWSCCSFHQTSQLSSALVETPFLRHSHSWNCS
ncbi:hypothetical protein L7F22_058398 [Adiantum nelumboides]|nr:hypothetical protein [Adiantum nelumboides]